MSNRIYIFDTTLRDGEQAPGAAMTLAEKLRIGHQLARLKVDIIEAGFPISSPQDFDSVAAIASEIEGPVICGLSRAKEADIKAAGEALKAASTSRIHTFIATSDIHIDAKFSAPQFGSNLSERRQRVIQMAVDAVKQAGTYTDDIEFSAEDAGRTDVGYLCDMVHAVVEAGATTINLPDTTGYCVPSEYAAMFKKVIGSLQRPDVIFSTHCHDDLGLAVANSLAGVLAGARQIECTINGIGERAGNASLEEVVMAMHVRQQAFDLHTEINTQALMETSRMVSVASGFPVPPNKAIVGKNAFSHEAGIHQHGVLKRRDTYEIMRAEDVGQEAEQIRLGRHSGRHGFFNRLEKMGVVVSDERREHLYKGFLALADQKKEIFEEDLLHLVQDHDQEAAEPNFVLKEMNVTVKTGSDPTAEVSVYCRRSGKVRTHKADGDGPVDALYRAINHAVGTAHELENYSINSVTEGADAIGEVTVLTSLGGRHFYGQARSTNVLQASAEAYIISLNRLTAYQGDRESVSLKNGGVLKPFGKNKA